ncbi:MAG: hypothetical protein AAB432_00890 [Patescibacteria group bacterium]
MKTLRAIAKDLTACVFFNFHYKAEQFLRGTLKITDENQFIESKKGVDGKFQIKTSSGIYKVYSERGDKGDLAVFCEHLNGEEISEVFLRPIPALENFFPTNEGGKVPRRERLCDLEKRIQ